MDSPLPASSSSLCSSTLVMTPAPLPQSHPHPAVRLHPNLHLDLNDLRYGHAHTQRGPAPKGALGPHISNLPRRARPGPGGRVYAPPPATNLQKTPQNQNRRNTNTKQPKKKVVVESESESESSAPTASCASVRGAFVPIRLPRLPTVLGHVRRVKRRPKPLTPAQARARRRCVQALPGVSSGVVLAFSDAEEEEGREEEGFDAVVRISISISTGVEASIHEEAKEDDTCPTTLRLGVPPAAVERDTGVPGLTHTQLRAAGAFALAASSLDKLNATGKEEVRKERARVLVCAPRDCAREAFGVGVLLVLALALGVDTDKCDPPAAPGVADNEKEGGRGADGAVHRLVMGWHDLPQPKPWRDASAATAPAGPPSSVSSPSSSASDDEEDEDEAVDGGGEGGGEGGLRLGLRDAWRGLLSRAGMDYLEGVRGGEGPEVALGEDEGGGGGQDGGEEDERGGGGEGDDSLPAP
ncbi:hypothetical protein C8R46DRAFT_1344337 [Mycena filopes]|nr:hypothetical protein C8R46DRAFT_1344337 [Mycena filopes]